ncbi:hypothetical protein JTF06_14370 [Desemzia sp. RIT804]|uniref:hypothetical protein n=1 Tax=Desemzia sp. RIT 804 TaxID=2810209 RepID=UPI0019519B8B|nr:hypothetical protein [Desemzia sp. RIT 804]MBM6616065.1 hypothetical protein [Desemzia sp. RIT 804]
MCLIILQRLNTKKEKKETLLTQAKRIIKRFKKETLLRKLLRTFLKIKTVGKQALWIESADNTCSFLVTFPKNDIWFKAHFVRSGQALTTKGR